MKRLFYYVISKTVPGTVESALGALFRLGFPSLRNGPRGWSFVFVFYVGLLGEGGQSVSHCGKVGGSE